MKRKAHKTVRTRKLDRAALDCVVWFRRGCYGSEVVHVAETPAAAQSFADGFNDCARHYASEVQDEDHAAVGSAVLDEMIDEVTPKSPKRKRGAA